MLRKRTSGIGSSETFLANLKSLDAYAKPLDDFKVKTFSGAAGKIIKYPFLLFIYLFSYLYVFISNQ